jgi:hypothetical protein
LPTVCWAAALAASDTMVHEARRAFNESRIIFSSLFADDALPV